MLLISWLAPAMVVLPSWVVNTGIGFVAGASGALAVCECAAMNARGFDVLSRRLPAVVAIRSL